MSKLHDFMVKNENSKSIFCRIMLNVYSWCCSNRLLHYLRYKGWMNDETYIRIKYKGIFGVEPDLKNPKNFNEKNNWRKLYDRNPYYTCLVDKFLLKKEVEKKLGNGYTFPLLGVWDSADDINFDKLPEKFVLKGNHSGGVFVCRDKTRFNKSEVLRNLEKGKLLSGYYASREWPYKDVPRKIIAEQYMGEDLTDFKNYCFNGKLIYTFVWENQGRADGKKPKAYFCGAYDWNWNKTSIEIDYPTELKEIKKPMCYNEMVRIAEIMSEGIPFVRVDCYIIGNHVYIGEMTFFPWGGFEKFKDEYWNNKLGELEVLPINK